MFRVIACCAVLILSFSLNAVAADSKPLDIMKFMKEQAASTRPASPHTVRARVAKPRQAPAVAHAQRPAHRAVAARRKPTGLPDEAAASFATQEPKVQIVASDELNDIDRAAPEVAATPAPTETTGSAVAAASNVQLVDNGEFNDIDRKAEARLPVPTAMRIADAHASAPQPSVSWWQWIGSAVANLFVALATAVHHLTGL